MSLKKPLGRYITIRKLKKSGLATAYLAYDPLFERKVVVKVLWNHMVDDPYFCTRLQEQANMAAALALKHSALVPLYDVVKEQDQLYFVMPDMSGGSLATRLQHDGPLPLDKIRRLLTRLAEVLHDVHQEGMIHGNIKANNVLFDENDEVYLADFAIIHPLMRNKEPETALYLGGDAPHGPNVDARQDVYQLGVLLFEMLTGHLPSSNAVDSIRLYRPNLPSACNEVIARALANQKEGHYSTARELAQAFEEALEAQEAADSAEQEQEARPPAASALVSDEQSTTSSMPLAALSDANHTERVKDKDNCPPMRRSKVRLLLLSILALLMLLMAFMVVLWPTLLPKIAPSALLHALSAMGI